jgi:hypothetical protein
MAVSLARDMRMTIIPVWLEDIPVEKRPYGIATKVRISLTRHATCLGCIAGALVEAVLRVKFLEAERKWASKLDRQ